METTQLSSFTGALFADDAVAETLPVGHMQWQPQFGSDDSDEESDGASLSVRYMGDSLGRRLSTFANNFVLVNTSK